MEEEGTQVEPEIQERLLELIAYKRKVYKDVRVVLIASKCFDSRRFSDTSGSFYQESACAVTSLFPGDESIICLSPQHVLPFTLHVSEVSAMTYFAHFRGFRVVIFYTFSRFSKVPISHISKVYG